jgi:hypothetical protein
VNEGTPGVHLAELLARMPREAVPPACRLSFSGLTSALAGDSEGSMDFQKHIMKQTFTRAAPKGE